MTSFNHFNPVDTISDCQADGSVWSDVGYVDAGKTHIASSKTRDDHSKVYLDGELQQEDDDDGNGLGIAPTNPNQVPAPDDTYEFKVVTDTHYYWIDVYVKAPWPLDTSEKGTQLGNGVLGDGTSTEAIFEYTIPTGTSAAFGDYLITADIWRGTDMSEYTETYTFTVPSD